MKNVFVERVPAALHSSIGGDHHDKKNMKAYCCWRVMAGLEKDIHLSFMIVGHTRCSVDGGFGMAKKKFRAANCDTNAQLKTTIEASAVQNKVSLFEWEWRDWDTYLGQRFRRITGITKFQHFQFSSQFPGEVRVKATYNGAEE